ncbi:MAG: PQQ-dependent sugar dehydrogenase [Flavobacteriaceae bacterium]|nr:PQQ-dependent sugar dehydrogenase [Flavobacteriaceae bacterium]
MRQFSFLLIPLFVISMTSCAQNNTPINDAYSYEVIVPDLTIPWGFTFLPDESILITEKSGEMIHYKNGKKTKVQGLPPIEVQGQGGLLDVKLHPDYSKNGWIYITYASAEGRGNGANTALMRFKLNGNQITNKDLLYKATPNTSRGQHFGSRIEFDTDGYLYFTIGDRGNRDVNPQDITLDGGKVYRLHDDGRIPEDNPFIDKSNAKKAIYSYGHRNPQGMKRHPKTGEIWTHEHGPRGGDEINIIAKGLNYGWPKISYGINYSGTKFTKYTSLPGMEQPLHHWTPSIAPSGMAFVTSDIYPELKGHLLVGSLKFQYVNLCILKNQKVVKEEKLLDRIGRVRSMRQGPDGYMYVGVENLGIVKVIAKK